MATKKQQAPEAATQSEESRRDNLRGVAPTDQTASGLAARELFGDPPEGPENDGSTQPIAGGDQLKADFAASTPGEPVGAQAQPAAFVSNGSIPGNVTSSPSGFVSLSTVSDDPQEAAKIAQDRLNSSNRLSPRTADGGPPKLSRELIDRLDANTLRAAAFDRGYDLGPQRGTRGTRAEFIKKQNEAHGEESGPEQDPAA